MPTPKPQPPTAEEAARIVNDAWRDPDWGASIWTAITTGARRGELCALRWRDLDLSEDRAVAWLRRAAASPEPDSAVPATAEEGAVRRLLDFELIHQDAVLRRFRTEADPANGDELRRLLTSAIRRYAGPDADPAEYELNIRPAGQQELLTTYLVPM